MSTRPTQVALRYQALYFTDKDRIEEVFPNLSRPISVTSNNAAVGVISFDIHTELLVPIGFCLPLHYVGLLLPGSIQLNFYIQIQRFLLQVVLVILAEPTDRGELWALNPKVRCGLTDQNVVLVGFGCHKEE